LDLNDNSECNIKISEDLLIEDNDLSLRFLVEFVYLDFLHNTMNLVFLKMIVHYPIIEYVE